MTLREYMYGIDEQLKTGWETWLDVNIGNAGLAKIKERVRMKGIKADSNPFKPYSTRTALIGSSSFTSKVHADKVFRQVKGKRKDKVVKAADGGTPLEWRKYKGHNLAMLPGGYKRIREIEGRQTGHKDFERTSALWKSIHVIGTDEVSDGIYRTTVGPLSERSVKIMEGIRDYEDTDLLDLSKEEQERLSRLLAEKLEKIFNLTG